MGSNERHFVKYEDPGHGWLAVHTDELHALGIAGKISGYSYQRNGVTYLEEDMDMSTFIGAMERAGVTVRYDTVHTNGDSFVRGLPHYRYEE